MSKTAAIAEARTYVSMPHRRSATDYIVCAPWNSLNPTGPSTELQASTYQAALSMRAEKVAAIALGLMGIDPRRVRLNGRTIEELVTSGIAQTAEA